MLNELRKILHEYELITVTEKNYPQLSEIFLTNQDYFLIEYGREVGIDDIWALAENRPPNLDPNDKFCVGIWKNGTPIAILDYLIKAPAEHVAYLSMLIIHDDYKRQYLGTKFANAFISAARICGFREVGLGVDDNNQAAFLFWSKVGFVQSNDYNALCIML